MTATVTEEGHIALPAATREGLALKAGQTLEVHSVSATEFVVRVVQQGSKMEDQAPRDPFAKQAFAKDNGFEAMRTDEWMKILREGEEEMRPDPFAAIGFAQRNGLAQGTTAEWMKLLREGEED